MKIKVKIVDVLNAPYIRSWDELCDKYGINEYCVAEGLVDDDDEIEIDFKELIKWFRLYER